MPETLLREGVKGAPASTPTKPSSSDGPGMAAPAPPLHSLRRAATFDGGSQMRRRSREGPTNTPSLRPSVSPSFEPRRRGSGLSDYSLPERRRSVWSSDLLNPGAPPPGNETQEGLSWASMPLVFALLPAVSGLLFRNGSAVMTDVILLGLAAVFLHWSVTQPWNWYESAQEMRILEDNSDFDVAVEDESDTEPKEKASTNEPISVDEVPEGDSPKSEATTPAAVRHAKARASKRQSRLRELYILEVLALVGCFISPPASAYLLHTIRSQLSRPSEGLVSDFNLTIFLLASELRPFAHLFRLLKARTLHLQRLVLELPKGNDDGVTKPLLAQLAQLAARLEALEAERGHESTSDRDPAFEDNKSKDIAAVESKADKNQKDMLRDVRNAIQPDLEALNRALRRYEKKITVLSLQTEGRLSKLDQKVNVALTLAAEAARNNRPKKGVLSTAVRGLFEFAWSWVLYGISLFFSPLTRLMRIIRGNPQSVPEPRSKASSGSRGTGTRTSR